jgi:hypothetical protein
LVVSWQLEDNVLYVERIPGKQRVLQVWGSRCRAVTVPAPGLADRGEGNSSRTYLYRALTIHATLLHQLASSFPLPSTQTLYAHLPILIFALGTSRSQVESTVHGAIRSKWSSTTCRFSELHPIVPYHRSLGPSEVSFPFPSYLPKGRIQQTARHHRTALRHLFPLLVFVDRSPDTTFSGMQTFPGTPALFLWKPPSTSPALSLKTGDVYFHRHVRELIQTGGDPEKRFTATSTTSVRVVFPPR